MNVLFVASECSPFIKTGGLADVIGSLPKSLNKEINCSVVIPYYKKIKEKNDCEYVGYTFFTFNQQNTYCGIFKKEIDGVTYFFIDNNEFFNYEQLYGFKDDIRFSFFNMAVLESLKLLGTFDILHLNDWHTGLIPFLIKYKYNLKIKTIFTIHNIQYQGIFDKGICKYFDIYNSSLEFNNNINFMKAGISNCDILTTVSKTYRDETLSYEYSYYLENILKDKSDDYYGIVNGLDTCLFNPNTDNSIYKNYNNKNIINKKYNKEIFCRYFGLNQNMLCSLVSRLCDQKGIELIIESLDEIINETNINFFFMGSGDKDYEEKLKYFSYKYPNRVKIFLGYNEKLAQKVYASSDMLFVPSKFEPCGLSQLIAMRYGTIPLVRETGGLKDTVKPYNKIDKTGTGFTFKNFTKKDFKEVLLLAYNTFNTTEWDMLIENAMVEDFSFDISSKEYLKLYKRG